MRRNRPLERARMIACARLFLRWLLSTSYSREAPECARIGFSTSPLARSGAPAPDDADFDICGLLRAVPYHQAPAAEIPSA